MAAVAEPRRVTESVRWARAFADGPVGRTQIAAGVLMHRLGVFVDGWAPAFEDLAAFRRRARLDGREHLDAAAGSPVIVLGWHLGAPVVRWTLIAHGYDVLTIGAPEWSFSGQARSGWPDDRGRRLTPDLGADHAPDRAAALARLRRELRGGGMIRLLADGVGRELATIPIGGRELTLRGGWWILARLTHAVVLPALAYGCSGQAIVTIHPPLPPMTSDEASDLRRTLERLTPLLQTFVQAHPEQCLPWHLASH